MGAAGGTGTNGESQISLTDPTARNGRPYEGRRRLQHPGRVDAKNKMIVEQAVTNQVVDMGLLKETAEPAAPFSMSRISMS